MRDFLMTQGPCTLIQDFPPPLVVPSEVTLVLTYREETLGLTFLLVENIQQVHQQDLICTDYHQGTLGNSRDQIHG